jgi:large repetitive protein
LPTSICGIRRYDPLPSMGGRSLDLLRSHVGRGCVLAALAFGLLLAPSSQGGGFPGVNGRVIAITTGGSVVAIPSTGARTTIASGATLVDGAALSPDATKVVYVASGQVHVHCIDNTCDRDLAAGTDPTWSPDGTKIAYVAAGGAIYDIAQDGSQSSPGTQIISSGAVTTDGLAWSPDGTKIAFTSDRGTHEEIWAATVSTGTQTQVTANSGAEEDTQPAWSPNGNTIAFASDRSGTGTQIYTVGASGGSLTQITSGTTVDSDPVWSPDSTKVAFTRSSDVYVVASSGGTATQYESIGDIAATADWETLVPTNSVPPTVSTVSNPIEGNTVSANRGTWSGASSFLYQFERCDSNGGNCVATGSASSSTSYTLSSADVGSTIRVLVQGVDTAGTAAAVQSSNFTPVILGPGPTNITLPTIDIGSVAGVDLTRPKVGVYVSADAGTWTGSGNTYTYQWVACDSHLVSCSAIANATSPFYLPTSDVYGHVLRVQVTATNADGSNTVNSDGTDTVNADAPLNTASPQIVGQNTQGQTLSVGTGTWTGTAPLVFTYQWRRCDPQGTLPSCVAIPGATTPSYTLAAGDVGVAIRAYVTATNVTGPVTAVTNHTFPTLPAPVAPKQNPKPVNTAVPTITGTPTVGSIVLASNGTWSGQTPLVYRYAWQRCDALGSACRPIAKAHGASYKLVAADLGDTIRVAVTASNKSGKATALSVVTVAISLGKPLPHGRHIVGSNRADYLAGGGGNDTILGRGGNDTILGGAGNDLLEGGPGNDVIDGGPGRDRIFGGPGNDTIDAVDGERDVIDCGPGRDHAIVDRIDVIKNCELITYGTPPATTSGSAGAGTGTSEQRLRR